MGFVGAITTGYANNGLPATASRSNMNDTVRTGYYNFSAKTISGTLYKPLFFRAVIDWCSSSAVNPTAFRHEENP